jgi:O-succinylbenzoic acid--CoA ligase
MNWLEQQLKTGPSDAAVRSGDTTWSFRELARHAAACARHLKEAGVGHGSRVAIYMHNSLDAVLAVHAALWRGATLVFLNRRLTQRELAWHIDDSAPELLLTDAGADVEVDIPVLAVDRVQLGEDAVFLSPEQYEESDVLTVMYTSGTTGKPKPVPLTWKNHVSSALGSVFNLGTDETDNWLCTLPLFHIGGLSILIRSVIYGTCFTVTRGFDVEEVGRLIQKKGITLASFVPTMLERILEHRPRISPGSLRAVLLGGAPASEALVERALLAGFPVLQTYGMTEACSQLTTMAPGQELEKLGSSGPPIFQAKIQVRDDEGEPAEEGESGDIWAAGPMVFGGYLDRPQANAEVLSDGWFKTGDYGRLDAEGFLWVEARRDDVIISGGENVYPREIEDVLATHPSVADSAVVGIQDAEWGEVVAAAIVLDGDVDEAELDVFCRERLAGFKVPRRWVFLDGLPRTAAGKTKRGAIRAAFGDTSGD